MMFDTIQNIAGTLLMLIGIVFMLLGSVGLVRLPDFFARTHAASKVDTVGIVVLLLGIAVIEGLTLNSGKLLVAVLFLMLTNPVSAHALTRAAMSAGIRPWRRGEPRMETPHEG